MKFSAIITFTLVHPSLPFTLLPLTSKVNTRHPSLPLLSTALDLPTTTTTVEDSSVQKVVNSWEEVKRIPDYEEVAGKILFQKVFELAPGALQMFSFANDFPNGGEEMYKTESFKVHSTGVIQAVDKAVSMLGGDDLTPLVKMLGELGNRHVGYDVKPEHYNVVGEALLKTLEVALGDSFTADVKLEWEGVWGEIRSAMLEGAGENTKAD